MRHHVHMQVVADLVVDGQHLARDLGVTRLIGAHQPELIATEDRHQTIEQQKRADGDQDHELPGIGKSLACGQVAQPAGDGVGLRMCGVVGWNGGQIRWQGAGPGDGLDGIGHAEVGSSELRRYARRFGGRTRVRWR